MSRFIEGLASIACPLEVAAALAQLRAARPDLEVLTAPEKQAEGRWRPVVPKRRLLPGGCTIS